MKFGLKNNSFLCAAGLLALTWIQAHAQTDCSKLSARTSPEWLRSATVYEIYPRHFSEAGNFAGVTARLDELQQLGVTVLWTMPIHPIGEKFRKGKFGSPYSIRDYYAVDPNYGTLEDFKKFVAAAHQRKMKVIMDLVANHTAWDSVMMTNKSFYKQDDKGNVIPPVAEWTDVAGLNYNSAELREYMIAMLKFWVKDCGVDGFRCDVAYMVPTDFWEQARVALTAVNPDIIMLAEASKPELLVKAFDMDYSWPLHGTLNNVMLHDAPASELRKSWEESRRQFPAGSIHLRISDNHDEARAIARFGIRGALAAQILMFTLDGVPLLYNGMEAGDATESGDPALFEKLPIFWNPKERPQFRSIYKDLIKLRKDCPAFRNDQVGWVNNSDSKDVVSFTRADDKDQFLVVINLSSRPVSTKLDVKEPAGFNPFKITGQPETGGGNLPNLNLKGFEWRIYHRAINTMAAK